jgi:hypothetical protein
MSKYRHKLLKVIAHRQGDPSPLPWYFDLDAQFDEAQAFCREHPELIRTFMTDRLQGPVPAGDFVSDASEFKRWARRE